MCRMRLAFCSFFLTPFFCATTIYKEERVRKYKQPWYPFSPTVPLCNFPIITSLVSLGDILLLLVVDVVRSAAHVHH